MTNNLFFIFYTANCPAGSYADPDNTAECLACDKGKYKTTEGPKVELCVACSGDLTTAQVEATSEDECKGKGMNKISLLK